MREDGYARCWSRSTFTLFYLSTFPPLLLHFYTFTRSKISAFPPPTSDFELVLALLLHFFPFPPFPLSFYTFTRSKISAFPPPTSDFERFPPPTSDFELVLAPLLHLSPFTPFHLLNIPRRRRPQASGHAGSQGGGCLHVYFVGEREKELFPFVVDDEEELKRDPPGGGGGGGLLLAGVEGFGAQVMGAQRGGGDDDGFGFGIVGRAHAVVVAVPVGGFEEGIAVVGRDEVFGAADDAVEGVGVDAVFGMVVADDEPAAVELLEQVGTEGQAEGFRRLEGLVAEPDRLLVAHAGVDDVEPLVAGRLVQLVELDEGWRSQGAAALVEGVFEAADQLVEFLDHLEVGERTEQLQHLLQVGQVAGPQRRPPDAEVRVGVGVVFISHYLDGGGVAQFAGAHHLDVTVDRPPGGVFGVGASLAQGFAAGGGQILPGPALLAALQAAVDREVAELCVEI